MRRRSPLRVPEAARVGPVLQLAAHDRPAGGERLVVRAEVELLATVEHLVEDRCRLRVAEALAPAERDLARALVDQLDRAVDGLVDEPRHLVLLAHRFSQHHASLGRRELFGRGELDRGQAGQLVGVDEALARRRLRRRPRRRRRRSRRARGPRRRTAREAGPAPRSAAPTPTSAVRATPAPSSLSGATAGGVRLGATSRGAPAVANTVIPWCASSDDASATRRPGSGWLISQAVVEPVPPCTHRTSVSSHGAATWTSACSMGTSQPAPTASQARAPSGAMSSRG